MTWAAAPEPTDHGELRLCWTTFSGLAVQYVDALEEAAKVLCDLAQPADDDPEKVDVETRALALALRDLRTGLFQAAGLQKQWLSRDVVQELREGFELAEIEDNDRRRQIVEDMLGREVESLWELSLDEAARLKARLFELEPKF
jgi:hypothetical protein